jgi:iron complex outermembrane receptor protein
MKPNCSGLSGPRRQLVLAGLLLALAPAVAQARQGASAPRPAHVPTAPADTTPPIPLAPLVVTVLRSSLDLSRVPAAVTVTDAAPAARGGPGLGLDDALRAIPGLQVDNRYNYALGERISIRGFGARTQFGVRGIRVVVDGVPATLPDGQTALDQVDLATVGRAEVLRGAASSLYGNAAGGVIQLESAPAPLVPFRQEFRTVAGSDGLLRVESRTGGTVGRLWYGVDGARLTYGGYREHSAATYLYAGARLGYRGARDDLRLVLRFVDLDAENPGSLSDSLLASDRRRAFPYNLAQRTGKTSQQLQLGGSWRRALGHGALEVAAYGLARQIENPTPPQVIDLDRAATGARIVYHGAARELRWTIGIEADRQRDDRRNHRNLQGERDALTLDQLERVTGIGAFGQLAAPLAPRLTGLAGLRYDAFRFRVRDRFLASDGTNQSGRRTMDALSPSLGVIYAAGAATSLYANFGTSFQTPTTTELANRPEGAGGFNPALQPERTRSLEAGVRGEVAERASYQIAAYRAQTKNALIGFEVPAVPGRTFYRNAGSAVHRGIEVESTAELRADVVLRLSYAYTDARFGGYRTAGEVLDGKRIPGVAPHRAEGSLGYRRAPGYLELWGRAVAGIPADDQNTATSPGYALAGLRAGAAGVTLGGIEVAPFAGVDNLFDRRHNAAVTINAAGGRYYEPGPGRSLFAGARLGFGGR